MKKVMVFLLLVTTLQAFAEGPSHGDPVGDSLFPPDKIMERRAEIGFSDEQKKKMMGIIHLTTVGL